MISVPAFVKNRQVNKMKLFLFTLCVCSVLMTISAKPALPDEHEEKFRKVSDECLSASGASKEAVEKTWNGEFDEADDKLKDHMLCFNKKLGSMTEDGKIDEEAAKKLLGEILDDEGEVTAIVDKCAVEKDTPKDTAFHMSKCIHEALLRTDD
ncbi:unnamed protein product [Callosobruchus maculatus]|uniref:Uncharacterized protein n=1 Tax=Callosobruchus maculatus TaxID=64391 RepID=A0A653CN32_CALMS|nr:unnamed protein product [Callosobruchus maculatus]